jgi:hypothetical protein
MTPVATSRFVGSYSNLLKYGIIAGTCTPCWTTGHRPNGTIFNPTTETRTRRMIWLNLLSTFLLQFYDKDFIACKGQDLTSNLAFVLLLIGKSEINIKKL